MTTVTLREDKVELAVLGFFTSASSLARFGVTRIKPKVRPPKVRKENYEQ